MPTYEYQCDACNHNFDEFQTITEEPLKKCPQCGKLKLRRVFGPGAAIIFKGSGFYQTDYRSESYQKAAKAEQEKAKGSDDKGGKGSDGSAAADSTGKGSSKGKAAKTGGKNSSPAT